MIKAIISDIGNVLVKIDLRRWISACEENGIFVPEDTFEEPPLKQWVALYGEGRITTRECAEQISKTLIERTEFKADIPFESFKHIWNSVILKLDLAAINQLHMIRENGYRVYALSDTNEMHIEYIETLYQKIRPKETFKSLFDKPYYSHITGYSKAKDEAWLQILKEQILKPEECLFVDDIDTNIQKAKRLGIHVFHYKPENTMQDVLITLETFNRTR